MDKKAKSTLMLSYDGSNDAFVAWSARFCVTEHESNVVMLQINTDLDDDTVKLKLLLNGVVYHTVGKVESYGEKGSENIIIIDENDIYAGKEFKDALERMSLDYRLVKQKKLMVDGENTKREEYHFVHHSDFDKVIKNIKTGVVRSFL